MDMVILISLFAVGWIAAALLGTQAYFRGEQSKPIHERNWRSDSFEAIASSVTGTDTDFAVRQPAYSLNSFTSKNLPTA